MEIIIVVVVVIAIVGWLVYEMIMAPLMPDDYGLTDEERKELEELTKENKDKTKLLNKHDRDPEWDNYITKGK